MKHRCIGGIAAVLLLLVSCGESTTPQASPETPVAVAAFPMTITDDDGVEVTIPAEPERIVTFAPSMTEIVFALGLGDRLVGVSGPVRRLPGGSEGHRGGRRRRRLRRRPDDREGRLARARPVPDDPRRRPVEAAPAGPRHPGRHPARGHARRSPRRHRDGRRAHGRAGGSGRPRDADGRGRGRDHGERGVDGARVVLLRGLLPAAHDRRPEHVHLRPAGAGRLRSGDRGGEVRLPGVVGGRARGRRSRGVLRDAGVREERRGGREAARVRRDPRDRGRPGGRSSTATW